MCPVISRALLCCLIIPVLQRVSSVAGTIWQRWQKRSSSRHQCELYYDTPRNGTAVSNEGPTEPTAIISSPSFNNSKSTSVHFHEIKINSICPLQPASSHRDLNSLFPCLLHSPLRTLTVPDVPASSEEGVPFHWKRLPFPRHPPRLRPPGPFCKFFLGALYRFRAVVSKLVNPKMAASVSSTVLLRPCTSQKEFQWEHLHFPLGIHWTWSLWTCEWCSTLMSELWVNSSSAPLQGGTRERGA